MFQKITEGRSCINTVFYSVKKQMMLCYTCSLPRTWAQEIKCMYPVLLTHGLIFNLNTKQCYQQITHNDIHMHRYMCMTTMILYQPTPLLPVLALACTLYMIQPLFLLTWRSCFFCSWCEYPSTPVPGLLSTVLPLLLHPPQGTPQIKLHIYIDDIYNISCPV